MDNRRVSLVWLSSSESEASDEEEVDVIAVTPYSRITAYERPVRIARKTLFVGNRPPHDPQRELAIHKFLKERDLRDPSTPSRHIIPLLSYEVLQNGRITLDFPLLQTDLKRVYKNAAEIVQKPEDVSLLIERFLEVLSGLEWLHELGIIHRDVNPANIFLSYDLRGPAFLGDLGIAWMEGYPDNKEEGIIKYSSGVGTGPYRAPELIFAPSEYGGEIDMWSFGCTVAELYTHTPTLFSDGAEDGGWSSSDLVLLNSIITILGTPTSETWPETKTFRDWEKVSLNMRSPLPKEVVLPGASPDFVAWVYSMIVYSQRDRASASQALREGRKLLSTHVPSPAS